MTIPMLLEPSENSKVYDYTILGRTEPRIFTPPLRDDLFTNEKASYGYKVIRFAREVLLTPLDDWQEVAVIRAGEYREDDKTPRFDQVGIVVARQAGKSLLLSVLSWFWLVVEKWPEVLATNMTFGDAKDAMLKTVALAEDTILSKLIKDDPKTGNMDVSFTTVYGTRYTAKAKSGRAGRGKTLDRVILDELREHFNFDTYDAAVPATVTRPLSQVIFASNAGYDKSVVLNTLRESAIKFIETGEGDSSLGWLEWSAPEGLAFTSYDDPVMWSYANPNMNRRLPVRKLQSRAAIASTSQENMISFQTEYLSQHVSSNNPAIDAHKWMECFVEGTLEAYKNNLVMFVDQSPDKQHATLQMAAIIENELVRIETAHEWEGADILMQLRRDLPGIIDKYKPKLFGWAPKLGAAGLATFLRKRKQQRPDWAVGVQVQEISAELVELCEGFVAEINSLQLVHSNDPLTTAQVIAAERLPKGDSFVFSRKGGKGHVDAVYAAAGAVYLARTLVEPDMEIFNF